MFSPVLYFHTQPQVLAEKSTRARSPVWWHVCPQFSLTSNTQNGAKSPRTVKVKNISMFDASQPGKLSASKKYRIPGLENWGKWHKPTHPTVPTAMYKENNRPKKKHSRKQFHPCSANSSRYVSPEIFEERAKRTGGQHSYFHRLSPLWLAHQQSPLHRDLICEFRSLF